MTVNAQAQISQLTLARGPGTRLKPSSAVWPGGYRVTPELALHDRLDGAAEDDDPQHREANLCAERRRGDELAGADNRCGQDHARPDTTKSSF